MTPDAEKTKQAVPYGALHVLLVDDDQADVELTMEVLEDAKSSIDLQSVRDGVQAMAYLHREGPYERASQPDLILLDLNMPKKDGREVLQELREDPYLCHIPVVVLTTSENEIDICRTYQLGANCYITKPVGLVEFTKIVQKLEDFWFMTAKLPGGCGP